MSNLDKEFNERFQYQKSSSDDDEMEDIWNAVESELDEESSERTFFYWFSGLLGVLLLSFIVAGTTYWLVSSTEQEVTIRIDSIEKNGIENTIEVKDVCLEEEVKSNAHKVSSESENDLGMNKNELSIASKTELGFDEVVYVKLKKETVEKRAEALTNHLGEVNFHSENNLPENEVTESIIINLKISETKEVHLPITTDNNNPPKEEPILVQLIDTKKFTVKNSEQSLLNPDVLLPSKDSIEQEGKKEKKVRNIAFALGVNGGINWTNQNYKGTNSNLTNASLSGDFGQSYGLEAIVTLKDRWIIQSGFEYHNFWTKFDYLNTDTEQVLNQNQLRKVWLDGTDTLNAEYGDVLINRTTTREVIHHNQFTQISIPVELGFKNTTGKFTYGMTFGAAFNFLLNQSGKVFDETSEITEYDNESVIKPLSDFNLGLRLSPFVGYHLSEKVILGLKPHLMLQQNKGDVQTNLSTSVRSVGLKIGLQVGL